MNCRMKLSRNTQGMGQEKWGFEKKGGRRLFIEKIGGVDFFHQHFENLYFIFQKKAFCNSCEFLGARYIQYLYQLVLITVSKAVFGKE